MKDLYTVAGISKQALWKFREREERKKQIIEEIVGVMKDIRSRHKRMGCRSMYYANRKPISVGRDIFEQIGFANGFKLHLKRSKLKTTWSQRVMIYPNLIEGMTLTGINEVWQSDIFYLLVEGQDYYGFSIEDVYSRRLLGLCVAKDLRAIHVKRALLQAFKERKGQDLRGCIFHSDRGSQYISQEVTQLLQESQMNISMCKLPQENAYVERLQGTLKYQYFFEMELKEDNLGKDVNKIKRYYNFERPHSELNHLSPVKFEETVEKMSEIERPKLKIFKWSRGLSTISELIDKKEKSSKKEKSQHKQVLIYS
jgi:transposase InsO family protein